MGEIAVNARALWGSVCEGSGYFAAISKEVELELRTSSRLWPSI